jgi:hypothetical protein
LHHIGAYLLGLLFSGGTILAAGSVLSSVKRSMMDSPGMIAIEPVRVSRDLPADARQERDCIQQNIDELELPRPPSPAANSLQNSVAAQSHATDASRKQQKKTRRAQSAKGGKARRDTPRAPRKNKKTG